MAKRRKNGSGTLVSKGRGKPWLAKWVYQGKIHYRSTGETDKQKAKDKLAEFVKPFQEDSNIEVLNNLVAKVKSAEELRTEKIDPNANILLDEAIEKYCDDLSTNELSEGSKFQYGTYLKKLIAYLKEKHPEVTSMKQVTEEIAKEFLEAMKNIGDTNRYNYRLLFFKKLWKVLGEAAGCKSNVWEKFEKRKVSKGTSRRELTREELAKIFERIKDDDQMLLLFSIGIYTGLRKGDCFKIRWDNIDLLNREVVIIPQKVKRHMSSPIHIPIHNALYGLLLARKQKVANEKIDDGGYVLPKFSRAGRAAEYLVENVFKNCDIKTFIFDEKGNRKLVAGFHSLRHTFVSLNINSGMNPMLVQKIVGHSTVNMTEHYFHQNRQAMVDGISKMPNLLKFDNGSDVIDVEVVEQTSVQLDQDVYQMLLKMSADGNINDTLRKLLSVSGCTVARPMLAMQKVA